MAYEGETMLACPGDPYNFSNTNAVVVSGDGPNFCGHLILNVGGNGGTYLHVAGIRTESPAGLYSNCPALENFD